jgi:DNA segregation ATPase FtsK/SpoIIIE, S-DNA-T family
MTTTITGPAAPVFPFSVFDPVHVGIDEYGDQVHLDLAEKNILVGGEPGGGKSVALNLLVAHAALSCDCRLVLVDGKRVELGPWRGCADTFVGPSIDDAISAFRAEQAEMNQRYDMLLDLGLRKITRDTGHEARFIVIDEYAYFSATVGTKPQQAEFSALSRDLVARGRAAGIIVILATQRPSHQVIDPSLRDLFAYRWAFRCTTDSSSDTVLGHGWAGEGYSAAAIDPRSRGVSWLLSETGVPRRIKTANLLDHDIRYLAAYAARLRRKDTPHDYPASTPRTGKHCQPVLDAKAAQAAGGERRVR